MNLVAGIDVGGTKSGRDFGADTELGVALDGLSRPPLPIASRAAGDSALGGVRADARHHASRRDRYESLPRRCLLLG